ncbi:MAG: hypothetical protein IIT59_04765, partial [Rhodocyclaceae bacterium]|nr:hypothetical protein [Rhodocyclaceae bacterium]
LTLDADTADTDFLARFKKGCPYAAVIYTTHGHTPEAPRYRIVIPFEEDGWGKRGRIKTASKNWTVPVRGGRCGGDARWQATFGFVAHCQ